MKGTQYRGRRVRPDAHEPLLPVGQFDYADAFEIQLDRADPRPAAALVRLGLLTASPWVRSAIPPIHRHVLRLRLAHPQSPGHLMGWRIVVSEPEVLQLEAVSPLLGRGVLVLRKPTAASVRFTTYLFFAHPHIAGALWTVVGPLHRRIARYLVECTARAAAGDTVEWSPITRPRQLRRA